MPKRKRDLLYFYLGDELHKIYHVNRPANIATCWNYTKNEWVKYAWTDVKRQAQRAYTTKEVAQLVGRFWTVIQGYIFNEELPKPQKSYPIGSDRTRELSHYRWSEKDIMRLHDLMLTKSMGRPRNDGLSNPKAMPTKAELQAMIRNETVSYIKDENGEFMPVWRETTW